VERATRLARHAIGERRRERWGWLGLAGAGSLSHFSVVVVVLMEGD
jgi:hypothetical protein